MAENNDQEKSSSMLNGESDLDGKLIIDSRGEEVGICKAVNIGEDGQISLSFEVVINEKQVIPTQTIPYNVISKITDVIELRVPINIKVAQSSDEIKTQDEIKETKVLEEQKGYYDFLNLSESESKVIMSQIRELKGLDDQNI